MNKTDLVDDSQQWTSFKTGSKDAFEYLFKSYADKLFNYGSKFTTDKALVKDCIQELFINLWNRKDNLGNPADLKNYLFKAFRINLSKSVVFDNKFSSIDDGPLFEITISREAQLISEEYQLDIKTKLEAALKELSVRQYEVVFLRYYEGLSFEDIAEIMELSPKGTYKVLGRAIAVLRKNLSKTDFQFIFLCFS